MTYIYDSSVVWEDPIDISSIVVAIGMILSTVWSVITSSIMSTKVYNDRVEVTYFPGWDKIAVPLFAIKSDPKAHELAGLPPLRDDALTVHCSEVIEFGEAKVKSTIIKGEPYTEIRIEPKDKEAFLSALKEARESSSRSEGARSRHYFDNHLPNKADLRVDDMKRNMEQGAEGGQGSTTSWDPSFCRIGYIIRSLWVGIVYIVCSIFFLRIAFYAFFFVIDPFKPRTVNDFERNVFGTADDLFFILGGAVISVVGYALDGIPTKICWNENSVVIFCDRWHNIKVMLGVADENSYRTTIIVPRDEIVSLQGREDRDFWEGLFRFPFEVSGVDRKRKKEGLAL